MKPSYLLQHLSSAAFLPQSDSLLGFTLHSVTQVGSAMVINLENSGVDFKTGTVIVVM